VCGASPTARDIVQSARAGVRWAQVLLNDALDRLAAALAGVVRALDPEALVLGGGLLVNADLFNPLHTRIRNLIVVTVPEVDSIVRSAAHGEMSPLRGALALARCDADALRLNGLGLT
jgi:predicted NBD/HSP70 family sugar kinase